MKEAKIEKTFQKTPYYIKAKTESIFEKNNVSVYVPENAFYSNFYMNFDVNNDVVTLHDDSVPVHKNITLAFNNVAGLTEEQLSKTYITTLYGYKLKYNTAHEYSVTFCQIMVDVSHDLDATSDKLFYPNKFHPLFLYNNDHHEHPKIVTDYFNNKKLLHNLSCLTQNGKYTLSFILSP